MIILALFGSNKLKTLGTDLGEAIKNFRKAMQDEPQKSSTENETSS